MCVPHANLWGCCREACAHYGGRVSPFLGAAAPGWGAQDSIAVYFLDTTLEPMYKKVILAMVKEAANSDELKVLTLDEFQLPSRTELPVLRPTSYELEHGYTWHVKWYTSHLECKVRCGVGWRRRFLPSCKAPHPRAACRHRRWLAQVSGSGESEVTFSGSFAVSSLGIVGHLQLKPHDGSVADIGETLPEMLDVTFEMLPRVRASRPPPSSPAHGSRVVGAGSRAVKSVHM